MEGGFTQKSGREGLSRGIDGKQSLTCLPPEPAVPCVLGAREGGLRDHRREELECLLPSTSPEASVQLAEVGPSEGPRIFHPRNQVAKYTASLIQCKD